MATASYTLTRERLDDDSDETTYELDVVFTVDGAEPDVGIMSAFVSEINSVKCDGVEFALTDAEEEALIAWLHDNGYADDDSGDDWEY